MPNGVVPGPPIDLRILGPVQAYRNDGEYVAALTPARAEVLELIALSGERGITQRNLMRILPLRDGDPAGALHRRISDLRNKCRIPISYDSKHSLYALPAAAIESIDATRFIDGVTALPAEPTIAELDHLMTLWRDDPATRWGSGLPWPWNEVVDARAALINHLVVHPDLSRSAEAKRFATLFPGVSELDQVRTTLSRRTQHKPRLLVVEDRIMTEIRTIVEADFHVVPISSLNEWNAQRDHLNVDAALVDLHLTENLLDGFGTTVIADHLRKNTELPVALMSVAAPARFNDQGDLRIKYRLVDIVHKRSAGGLNGHDLLHAARELVSMELPSRLKRLNLWVDSDEYHLKNDFLLYGRANRDEIERCGRQAEAIRAKARSAAMNIEALHAEVMRFHQRWGPRRSGVRS